MRSNSRSCLISKLIVACGLLIPAAGCSEAWQRKFTRKPKTPQRLSPVIQFQDYSQAMTPMDRYRKHYAIFNYWNAELLDGLGGSNTNPKRVRQASSESLNELRTLQGLLVPAAAGPVDPLLAERARIDQQIQSGLLTPSQWDWIRRQLETQTRAIHRTMFWRNVEDQLKPKEDAGAVPPAKPADANAP